MEGRLEPGEGLRGWVSQLVGQGDRPFQGSQGLLRKALVPQRVCQISMQGHTGVVADLVNRLLFGTWVVAGEAGLQMVSGFREPPHMHQRCSGAAMTDEGRHMRSFFFR